MGKRKVGSVYVGKCLGSHNPELWYYYVLLSRDREGDGNEYWAAAMFCSGRLGAQIEKFTDSEIDQLGYVGHISSVLVQSMGIE